MNRLCFTLPGRTSAVFALLSAALVCSGAQAADVGRERSEAVLLAAAPAVADYDLGYRDGYHKQAYRDKDRSNKAYGDGYKAGEARRLNGATGGSDYDTGYRDGLNNLPYRDSDRSNKTYGDGYRAGEAQRRAGGTASGGPDYDLGYRDGYNSQTYRDKDRSNKAYADGYKAGQERRSTTGAASGTGASTGVARGPDFDLGYRDGLNKRAYRDGNRSNIRYGEGYKAGQTQRDANVTAGPDFELGFRDAVNKAAYRDAGRKNARYADGYRAGQAEVSAIAGPATTRPVFPSAAALPDVAQLLGRREPGYIDDLKQMGYTQRNNYSQGDDAHGIWRGKDPDDCVHIMQRDGLVKKVERVEAASCR